MGVFLWVPRAQSFIIPLFAEVSLYQHEQTQESKGNCSRVLHKEEYTQWDLGS